MPSDLVVLIVEDHPAKSDSLNLLVENRPGVTVLAANGFLASAIWINGADRIDLLLCEVQLTGEMDGVDVAELAAKTHPQCTIVLFSRAAASTIEGLSDRYSFVRRPFKQTDVTDHVDRAVVQRRVTQG